MFVRLLPVLLLSAPSLQFWLPSLPYTDFEDNSTDTRFIQDREDMLTTLDHVEAIAEDAVDTTNQLINQAAQGVGHLVETNADVAADVVNFAHNTLTNTFDFIVNSTAGGAALLVNTFTNAYETASNVFDHKVDIVQTGIEDGAEAVHIVLDGPTKKAA